MSRLASFHSYATHPWFKRLYLKLSPPEIALCEAFIADNGGLTKMDFEFKINRMFLDNNCPPKNWKLILELLTCANSHQDTAR